MQIVDQVAFRRIAAFLIDRAETENPVQITHQVIANELGSSREVISRLPDDFAERGLIRLSRGTIEAVDAEKLHQQVVL